MKLVCVLGTQGGRRLGAALGALFCSLCAACSDSNGDDGSEEPGIDDVAATVSEQITTVVTVTWSTPEPSVGYVEYGPTEDLGLSTPVSEDETTNHSQLLLGLTANTPYYYRVVAGDGSDAKKSAVKQVRTGYLPPGTPTPDVVGDGLDQFLFVTVLGANNGAYVFNPEGKVVWYWPDDGGLQSLRTHLSRDKKSILYNAAKASGDPSPDSTIVRVALDGSESSSINVPNLAHDFLELPDGSYAAITVDNRMVDGVEVKSNSIVEVALDGTVTEVWSAFDCFDPAVNVSSEPTQGWTLANSLDYDEDEDVFYFGTRGLSSIVRINRETYECDWVFGAEGDIGFADGSAQFLHQHQFEIFDENHVIVYDNDGAGDDTTRVVEYEVDFDAGVATEVWSFTSTPPVYTPVLGEVLRMSNGDTLVDWSYAGQIERVTPDGETTWMLNTGLGYPIGYVTIHSSFY
jgi:hypothetical protein